MSNDEKSRNPGPCDHGLSDLQSRSYSSTASSSETQESTAYTEYRGPQLVDKLAAAKKPAVGQPLVIEGSTVCGPRGNAADTKMQELNNNKNRTDEPTNCNLLNPDEVDWHMYLTKGPRQPINTAIIVETTPRVRPNHKWTTQMVAAYVNQMKQLRISGWLMYDFQHLDVVGRDRGTVWEVHPITKIEVQDQAGNWANLEQ